MNIGKGVLKIQLNVNKSLQPGPKTYSNETVREIEKACSKLC